MRLTRRPAVDTGRRFVLRNPTGAILGDGIAWPDSSVDIRWRNGGIGIHAPTLAAIEQQLTAAKSVQLDWIDTPPDTETTA